ncbi:MAG: hypothetical protein AAFZ52_10500 [Bacteroidota bacterium]
MTQRIYSILLLACGLTFTTTSLCAQRAHIGGFQLKKFGVSIGQDQDMLGDMSAAYFLSTARSGSLQNDYSQLDMLPSDTYSMICENPHLRANLTWEHQKITNLELGTNLVLITGRIDAMQFRSEDFQNWLSIDQFSNEIVLEPTLGWRMGRGAFHLTGIIGGNLGYHWGDMSMWGNTNVCESNVVRFRSAEASACPQQSIYDYSPTTSGLATRVFAEAKASFQIARRLEMGVHVRRGTGLRFAAGAATQRTTLHSGGLSMAWVLR